MSLLTRVMLHVVLTRGMAPCSRWSPHSAAPRRRALSLVARLTLASTVPCSVQLCVMSVARLRLRVLHGARAVGCALRVFRCTVAPAHFALHHPPCGCTPMGTERCSLHSFPLTSRSRGGPSNLGDHCVRAYAIRTECRLICRALAIQIDMRPPECN